MRSTAGRRRVDGVREVLNGSDNHSADSRPAGADAEQLPVKPVLRSDIPGSATTHDPREYALGGWVRLKADTT
jgi:hypothetical protein